MKRPTYTHSFATKRIWAQYQKLLKQLQVSIQTGRFYQLSKSQQQQFTFTLKRYIKRLTKLPFAAKKIAIGTTLLASLITTTTTSAQVFVQPPCSNSLGNVDVGDNSYPIFADINNDGLQDAFIGNEEGQIHFFSNTGTTTVPNFVEDAANNPFAGVDIGSNAIPFFVDIDGDMDLDAFIGNKAGTVDFYQNDGTANNPIFTLQIPTNNPLNAVNTGTFAAPILLDIDKDGDLDAFVSFNAPAAMGGNGQIAFYRNDGTNLVPSFTQIIDAANPANALPIGRNPLISFADHDQDGDLDLFVGSQLGMIQYYENTGNATTPTYQLATDSNNPFSGFDVGRNVAIIPNPCFVDINGDGNKDVFLGSVDGVVNYLESDPTIVCPDFVYQKMAASENPTNAIDVSAYAEPDFVDIDADGDADLFVADSLGQINFFQNDGTPNTPNFTPITGVNNPFDGIDVGSIATIDFVDINKDGLQDAFIGEASGGVNFFQNNGTATNPSYVQIIGAANPFNGVTAGTQSSPAFADIDQDGDIDAFIGNLDGQILFFRNDGTPTVPSYTQFTDTNNPFFGVDLDGKFTPTFADIDKDGDLDALIGNKSGTLYFFRNDGSATNPKFVGLYGACNPFNNLLPVTTTDEEFSAPTFVDINNDGNLDLFTGQFSGRLCFLTPIVHKIVEPPVEEEEAAEEEQIPTMSEWGRLTFGLLVLNLSLFFLRRLEQLNVVIGHIYKVNGRK